MCTKWRMVRCVRYSVRYSIVLCFVVALLSGCSLLPDEENPDPLPPIPTPKFNEKPLYSVKRKTLETSVSQTGEMFSEREEHLFFAIAARSVAPGNNQQNPAGGTSGGRVTKINYKEGDTVPQGATIIELDTEEKIRTLQELQFKFREEELQMIKLMRGEGETLTAEQLSQRKKQFDLKRSEIQKLADEIAKAKLVAPFTGTIVGMSVQVGDNVTDYQRIVHLADPSQLIVAVQFSETDNEQLNRGMRAQVEFKLGDNVGANDGEEADTVFDGVVERLPLPTTNDNEQQSSSEYGTGGGSFDGGSQQQKTVDPLAGYTLITVNKLPKTVKRLDKVDVTIVTERKENVLVVPNSTVRTFNGRSYVQVRDDKGAKREVDVELGLQASTEVEIVKGLQVGQKVVGK